MPNLKHFAMSMVLRRNSQPQTTEWGCGKEELSDPRDDESDAA